MKIKCVNACDTPFFGCTLEVVVEEDGSFHEAHLRHFRMDLDELAKWVVCAECGDSVKITN